MIDQHENNASCKIRYYRKRINCRAVAYKIRLSMPNKCPVFEHGALPILIINYHTSMFNVDTFQNVLIDYPITSAGYN